jgi:hypothetical protein
VLEVQEHVVDLKSVIVTDKDMSKWTTVAGKAKLILADAQVQDK